MKNYSLIKKLIKFIQSEDGIKSKATLSEKAQNEFNLTKDRSIYFCDDFAIRFSQSKSEKLGNTILSLSALQKYDTKPVFLCITTPKKNYLLLMNTTFLSKISHSSQELRVDNIKGSFNGSDILREVEGIKNIPENFEKLFDIHKCFTFKENLERLVESTNKIVPTGKRWELDKSNEHNVYSSIDRAIHFIKSTEFLDLCDDLNKRVKSVQNEIIISAFIDNVNIRGRIIEYLITSNGGDLKDQLIDCLNNKKVLPKIVVKDGLGDYSKEYVKYRTETDIKTKVMFLNGNPKAYNIDKLLSFLGQDKTVYMIYLIGITEKKEVITRLISVFDEIIIKNTMIMRHWAGRNSRGVSQFLEQGLLTMLNENYMTQINEKEAKVFLKKMIEL